MKGINLVLEKPQLTRSDIRIQNNAHSHVLHITTQIKDNSAIHDLQIRLRIATLPCICIKRTQLHL